MPYVWPLVFIGVVSPFVTVACLLHMRPQTFGIAALGGFAFGLTCAAWIVLAVLLP